MTENNITQIWCNFHDTHIFNILFFNNIVYYNYNNNIFKRMYIKTI